MTVGITVLWLVVNYFKNFGGFVRFLLSFVTVVIVAGLGTLSYSTEFSNETAIFLTFFAFLAIAMLVAITAAGKLCYWKYRPLRFMLWMALWTILCSVITTFGLFFVGTYIMSSGSKPDISEMILSVSMIGLIFGLCLYMLNLPFMLLGFANPFFRERFCACLFPKSTPRNAAQPDTSQPHQERAESGESA